MTITDSVVSEILNKIIDPCSAVAGVPSGLVDMGMVDSIDISTHEDGVHIEIELLMTEFGCLMAVPFRVTATEALSSLPEVACVDIRLCTSKEWSEDLMTPSTRHSMTERRLERRQNLGIPTTRKATHI